MSTKRVDDTNVDTNVDTKKQNRICEYNCAKSISSVSQKMSFSKILQKFHFPENSLFNSIDEL